MKKILYFIAGIGLVAAGCGRGVSEPAPQPVACTQEAKQCPDGSYVSRSGSKCEFAACPEAKATSSPPLPIVPPPAQSSGISGYIHTGPSCPVVRNPPDPGCADRPYANADVSVANAAGKQYQTTSNMAGNFSVALAPGTYTVTIISSNMLPRCPEQQAVVSANKFTTIDIPCDSGIR